MHAWMRLTQCWFHVATAATSVYCKGFGALQRKEDFVAGRGLDMHVHDQSVITSTRFHRFHTID